MPKTMEGSLTATYAEKEKGKALGARFDSDVKKLVVPKVAGLGPFRIWLLAAAEQSAPSPGGWLQPAVRLV